MSNEFKFSRIGCIGGLAAVAIFSFASCAPRSARNSAGRYPDRNLTKPDAGDTGVDLAWRAGSTPQADKVNEIAVGSTLVVRLRNLDGWLLKKLEDGVISGEPAMSPADKKNFFLYLQIRDQLSADKVPAFKNNVVVGAKTQVTEADLAPHGVTYHDLLTAKIDYNNLLTDVRRGLFLVLNNSQFRQVKAENPDALELSDKEVLKDSEDDTLYELEFRVQRLAGDEDAWGNLYDGTESERDVRVSLGVELDRSVYVLDTAVFPQAGAKVQQVRIVLFQRGWLWSVLFGLAVLLVVLLMLSVTTALLRDGDIPLRADGWEQYSLARLQLAFWTYLVVGAFLIIWLVTERLDTLNSTILALIGISSGTLLASKLANSITLGDGAIRADPARAARRGKSTEDLLKELGDELIKLKAKATQNENDAAGNDAAAANDSERARLAARIERLQNDLDYLKLPASMRFFVDILSEDGHITLHRLQIVIWTVVLGLVFVEQVTRELSMPVFSETLLGLMGLSSATYIALKVPALKKVQADVNATGTGGG